MENRPIEISSSPRFIWRIDNFSKLDAKLYCSDIFTVSGQKWKIVIYPKGINGADEYLSMYLKSAEDNPDRVSYVEFSLAIVNQISINNTVKFEAQREFTSLSNGWGFSRFLPVAKLCDPDKGYLVNDTFIVKVDVFECRWMDKNSAEDQSIGLVASEQQSHFKVQPAVPVEVVKQQMENGSATVQEEPVKKKVKQESCLDYIPLLVVEASPEAQVVMQYQRAGKPFEFGQSHHVKGIALDDEKFEDVGGFSVLKSQASLYKNIWLKYGHIASTQVLTASSYMGQVWLVADIMSSIVEMTHFRFVDVSSETIQSWENKIKMAEALEFNIKWLRERLEDVKKCFKGIQKCKNALQEQVQPLKAAKVQVIAAANELKKAQSRLIAAEDKLRENISSLAKRMSPFSVSESEIGMYLEKGDTLILDGIF